MGSVIYDGEELNFDREGLRRAMDMGIAVVYQELLLVPEMTVGENIFLGREPVTASGSVNWNKLYADTRELLKKYNLNIPFSAKVSSLVLANSRWWLLQRPSLKMLRCLSLMSPPQP
jgi:D-xylose transport system ATP-binding protein